jgi:uncharacterized protein (TIGR03083 family)
MEVVRALEEAWSGIDSLLASLDDDQWMLPTPNTEWDVKDLAAHLGGLEAMFQGFPQPDPPDGWVTEHTGLDQLTDFGVAARRGWTTSDIMDEFRRASQAQLEKLQTLGEDDWQQQTLGPLGMTSMTNFADIRLGDLYVHLLDLRYALGLPLQTPAELTAQSLVVGRAVRLTGWGAVKGAGLGDGTRVNLNLSGPGGTEADLVVSNRRGNLTQPEPVTTASIVGPALAYLLEIAGRHDMAEAAGGLNVEGQAARTLIDGYQLFG